MSAGGGSWIGGTERFPKEFREKILEGLGSSGVASKGQGSRSPARTGAAISMARTQEEEKVHEWPLCHHST